jgi:hypothetical protein
MDRLEREISPSGFLVGEFSTVADLTGAALSTMLTSPWVPISGQGSPIAANR